MVPIEPAEMVLAALGLAWAGVWLGVGADEDVDVGGGATGRAEAVDELDPVRACGCGRTGGASGPTLPLLETGGAEAEARDKLEGAGWERLRCC